MKKLAQKKPVQSQKRNLDILLERGKSFVETIKPSDSVLIVHHADVDGYCSGAIFSEAIGRLGKTKSLDLISATNEDLEELLKNGKAGSYERLVILDIDIPYLRKELESLQCKILIVDHHTVRADLNTQNIVYINPRFEDDDIYQPVSYVVYKLLSSFVDLNDVEWIAVLGTIGDFGFEDCKDLLSEWVSVKSKLDLTETEFWRASKILYGAIIAGVEGAVGILLSKKSVSGIASDEKILSAYKKFEIEYKKAKKEFWANSEKIGDVVFSVIEPGFKRLGSSLVTDISLAKKDSIIVLLENRGNYLKINSRCQSGKVHMGRLMEKCASPGGGHKNAAGGVIKASELEKFKKCLISNLG